jgi:hypothetical protein
MGAGCLFFFFLTVICTCFCAPSEESISERLPPSDLALFSGEPKGTFRLDPRGEGKAGFGERPGGRFLLAVIMGRMVSMGGSGIPSES